MNLKFFFKFKEIRGTLVQLNLERNHWYFVNLPTQDYEIYVH